MCICMFPCLPACVLVCIVMSVRLCVCMCVCMRACVYVCVHAYVFGNIFLCMRMCMPIAGKIWLSENWWPDSFKKGFSHVTGLQSIATRICRKIIRCDLKSKGHPVSHSLNIWACLITNFKAADISHQVFVLGCISRCIQSVCLWSVVAFRQCFIVPDLQEDMSQKCTSLSRLTCTVYIVLVQFCT